MAPHPDLSDVAVTVSTIPETATAVLRVADPPMSDHG